MKNLATRVLLVDDHALFRAGLRLLLEHMAGVEVVGEAADGREAVQLLRKLRPDVVLMDISMAGLNGLEATAQISQDHREVRVIVLSMHMNEQYVTQALRAGAAGYLLKDSAAEELEQALRTVARGGSYLSHAVSQQVIVDYRRRLGRGAEEPPREAPVDPLTPRQREILQLVAEGRTTREIASLLHRSEKTIEAHRSRLMNELDIHDVAGLVRYAIRIGLVSSEK